MTPMVRVYGVLCVLGTVVPLWFLGSFVAGEGIDVGAFSDQLTANDIALFAWSDVAVSALAVIAFALHERSKGLATWWLPVVATLTIGVSLGLPLLLLLRERAARTAKA
jgi:Terpene cyclase DEP1